MAGEEEYTFSQLMRIITDVEEKVSKLYEKLAQKTCETKLKDLFLSFSKRVLQQKETLTETRRRSVTEMTLEPITGLKLREKLAEINGAIKSEGITIGKLVELEEVLSALYKTVSKKISHISADVGFLLDNLSREHKKRKRTIENLR